jgi:DNA helicase-2/ATP-dependent DNA helicase PcrA
MEQKLILGGPGCGKTTKLLGIIEKELDRGIQPEEILFCSFTKKATNEALERVHDRFKLGKASLPYFKTLHALAFMQLGLKPNEVMGNEHFEELGQVLGLSFSNARDEFGFALGGLNGDRIAFQEQMVRVTKQDLDQTHLPNYWVVKRYSDTLFKYKKEHALLDHTDIIHEFAENGPIPEVKVVFVDEAQDLSPVQWDVVDKLIASPTVERVYIAGDDDQAIYTWAGADINHFLNLQGEKEVLPVSHRLTRKVFNHANEISSRIRKRYQKEWSPRDEEGKVARLTYFEHLDLENTESWLFLARSNYLLEKFEGYLYKEGYLFDNKGRPSFDPDDLKIINEYEKLKKGNTVSKKVVGSMLRRLRPQFKNIQIDKSKDKFFITDLMLPATDWDKVFNIPKQEYYRKIKDLNAAPRIKISTIHSVKGGEADNVVLVSDIPPRTYREMESNPDDEHRVFYVAATRARNSLYIMDPKTPHAYRI